MLWKQNQQLIKRLDALEIKLSDNKSYTSNEQFDTLKLKVNQDDTIRNMQTCIQQLSEKLNANEMKLKEKDEQIKECQIKLKEHNNSLKEIDDILRDQVKQVSDQFKDMEFTLKSNTEKYDLEGWKL